MPQSPIASTSQQSFPPQHPHRRAKNKSSEYLINETSMQMKDTFNTLNSVLKDRRTEEDECDLYCKLLAKKLRGLPENERTIFMYEIDGMFIKRLRNVSTSSPNFYIPQGPTSSHSSDSEPFHNVMRKRPNSSCTTYSEPAILNKSSDVTSPPVLQFIKVPVRSPTDTPQLPKKQNTALMTSLKSSFTSHPALSPQTIDPPVIHIPDPNYNLDDNSQSVTILSDQVIVTPITDYLQNFKYIQE